jgi:PIN domain nuclease of toxin-antitoxin system
MRVLLDTQTFLWGITQESRLSEKVRLLLLSAQTWFSVASVWEILTKVQVGKLSLPRPTGPFLTSRLAANPRKTSAGHCRSAV